MNGDRANAEGDDSLSRMAKRVDLRDFSYGEFDAKRSIGPGRWPYFDLFWVHSGRIRLQFMGRHEENLKPGEGVLIFPQTEFAGTASHLSRASVHHFAIDPDGDPAELPLPYRRLLGRRHGYDCYRPRARKQILSAIAATIDWAYCRQTPMIVELRVTQFASVLAQLTLGAQQIRETDVATARFETLIDELRLRLSDPPSLDEMALRFGLSTSHFRARFREHFGIAPGAYLNRMRLLEAARLLRETNLPVKTIARQAGFVQVTAFYRAFHARIGMPPVDYRRRYSPRG